MESTDKKLIATVTLECFEHQIHGKKLYSCIVTLPDGSTLEPEFLYDNAKQAVAIANGRFYGWLKNRK